MTPHPDTAPAPDTADAPPRHQRGGARRALTRSWREALIPLGAGDTAAIPPLRAITRSILTGWNVPTGRVDDVELAVSELATNALIHTSGPVRVRLAYRCGTVRLDVADTSARRLESTQAHGNDDALDGRGLLIVEALADRTRTEAYAAGSATGKAVIAEFRVK